MRSGGLLYLGIDSTFIHAFDDPHVMAGNGVIGLEILEDLPDVDAVLIPWGGGGLACGIASALRAKKPACKVFATEVDTAAPLAASLSAGTVQVIDYQPSFVDGIGSKTVFPQMLDRARQLIDGALVAKLAEVAAAVRLLAECNRVIAEGAGAAPWPVPRPARQARARSSASYRAATSTRRSSARSCARVRSAAKYPVLLREVCDPQGDGVRLRHAGLVRLDGAPSTPTRIASVSPCCERKRRSGPAPPGSPARFVLIDAMSYRELPASVDF